MCLVVRTQGTHLSKEPAHICSQGFEPVFRSLVLPKLSIPSILNHVRHFFEIGCISRRRPVCMSLMYFWTVIYYEPTLQCGLNFFVTFLATDAILFFNLQPTGSTTQCGLVQLETYILRQTWGRLRFKHGQSEMVISFPKRGKGIKGHLEFFRNPIFWDPMLPIKVPSACACAFGSNSYQ